MKFYILGHKTFETDFSDLDNARDLTEINLKKDNCFY